MAMISPRNKMIITMSTTNGFDMDDSGFGPSAHELAVLNRSTAVVINIFLNNLLI